MKWFWVPINTIKVLNVINHIHQNLIKGSSFNDDISIQLINNSNIFCNKYFFNIGASNLWVSITNKTNKAYQGMTATNNK